MAKRDLTNHQRKIVNRYYEHRDTISLNKLGDIVGELYLCDSEKKAATLWKRVETALKHTKANPARVEKIIADRDREGLAKLVNELM
ncbi:MAG: hypothetical protein GC159_15880 [Phycisphaera sp.]|nr:hypothetical protein [Phycisphaera sp.]